MFGDKIKGNQNIGLVEGSDLITDENSLSETFNNYFINVDSIGSINFLDDSSGKVDIFNYENYPSIITIKQHMTDKNISRKPLAPSSIHMIFPRYSYLLSVSSF